MKSKENVLKNEKELLKRGKEKKSPNRWVFSGQGKVFSYWNCYNILGYLANKGPYSQSYGFSSSLVWMWELDHKESWALKNDAFKLWCWRRLLRASLDCKEIKPVKCKGNQSSIVTGRTDAEAPRLWSPDVKNWLTVKDPDAGKEWRQEEKETMDMSLSRL